MAERKAASVLPEPVGAAISAWRRSVVWSQARVCTSVGAPKRAWNQPATAGWKSACMTVIVAARRARFRHQAFFDLQSARSRVRYLAYLANIFKTHFIPPGASP